MICVLAFHKGDKDQAVRLAEWIRELGGCESHQCLLVVSSNTTPDGVAGPLKEAFGKFRLYHLTEKDPGEWPSGPNLLFRRAAYLLHSITKDPWLWLEPDAIPLAPHWLDDLEAEYRAGRKPFMGELVNVPNVPKHMSGVAIYPWDAVLQAPLLVTCDKAAFDVNSAEEVLPKMRETSLIQHEFRPKNADGTSFEFTDLNSLRRLREGALVYHQDKRGGIIELLRKVKQLPDAEMERVEEQFEKGKVMVWGKDLAAELQELTKKERQAKAEASILDSIPAEIRENFTVETTGGKVCSVPIAPPFRNYSDEPALKEGCEATDMAARLSGRHPPHSEAVNGIVERLAGHLALISSEGPKGKAAVKAALVQSGLLPTTRKPGRPKKRTVKK